jgi:hypothetical protein
LFFAVLITGLSSQELSGNNQEINLITAISVSELKRTNPCIIENPLRKFIGKYAGSIDINDMCMELSKAQEFLNRCLLRLQTAMRETVKHLQLLKKKNGLFSLVMIRLSF